jgi:DNA polymerase III gamma/tau subunit
VNSATVISPPATAGELLAATERQLRARRDELEPLVTEYSRLQRVRAAFGELPDAGPDDAAAGSARGEYAELLSHERQALGETESWLRRIEPLVREYHQVLHVLAAVESAGSVSAEDVRRRRGRVARSHQSSGELSAAAQARIAELRSVLREPRTRAEVAEAMKLSMSRVTELLDSLARAGEVVETPDPKRRSRKLWALAEGVDPGTGRATGAPAT